jgi:hypothetical protein
MSQHRRKEHLAASWLMGGFPDNGLCVVDSHPDGAIAILEKNGLFV